MIKLCYTLSENDYLAFNYHYKTKSRAGRRTLLLVRLMLPAMMVLELAMSIILGTTVGFVLFFGIDTVVFSALWISLSGVLYKAALKSAVKRQKLDGELPFSKEGTLTFDEKGVLDERADSSVSADWSKVESVWRVAGDGSYIFINSQTAFIVKDRCFESEELRRAFDALVDARVPQDKIRYYKK